MLNYINLSQRLIDADYAVRGRIVIRAQELENKVKKSPAMWKSTCFCTKPMTYVRRVLSLLEFSKPT